MANNFGTGGNTEAPSNDDMPTLESALGDDDETENEVVDISANKVKVKFVWYYHGGDIVSPTSLLTSDKVNGGYVQLFYDELYGGFISSDVISEKGTHEGQLCYKYTDGYEDMYPVKPFEVTGKDDLIVLTWDVGRRKKGSGYSQQYGSGYGNEYGSEYGSQRSTAQDGTVQSGTQSGSQYRQQQYTKFLFIGLSGSGQGQNSKHSRSKLEHLSDEPYQGSFGRERQRGGSSESNSLDNPTTSNELNSTQHSTQHSSLSSFGNNLVRKANNDSVSQPSHSNVRLNHPSNEVRNDSSAVGSRFASTGSQNARQNIISSSAPSNDISSSVHATKKGSVREQSNSQLLARVAGMDDVRSGGVPSATSASSQDPYSEESLERMTYLELLEVEQQLMAELLVKLNDLDERADTKGIDAKLSKVKHGLDGSPDRLAIARVKNELHEVDLEIKQRAAHHRLLLDAINTNRMHLGIVRSMKDRHTDVTATVGGSPPSKKSPVMKGKFPANVVSSTISQGGEVEEKLQTISRLKYKVGTLENEIKNMKAHQERQQKEYHDRLREHMEEVNSDGQKSELGGKAASMRIQERVFVLENSLRSSQQEKEAMQQVIAGNCQKVAELEKTIKKKASLLNAQKEKVQELEADKRKLEQQVYFFSEEHEAIHQKLEGYKSMVSQYDAKKEENERLHEQLRKTTESGAPGKITYWEEEIQQLKEECEELKRQLSQVQSSGVPSGSEEISDVDMARKSNEDEFISSLQQRNADLEESLQIVRTQCTSSEEALSELNGENDRLKKEVEQMQSKESAHQTLVEEWKGTIAEQQSEIERKNAELSDMKADLVHVRAEMETKMADLTSEKTHLLTENAHLRELTSNPTRYEEAKAEIEKMEEKIVKLEGSLEKEKQKTNQFMEKSVELQQQLKKATDPSQLEAVQKKVQDLKGEREELRTEKEKLMRKIQAQERMMEVIQGHLLDSDKWKQQAQTYKEEQVVLRRERDSLAEEMEQLKREIAEKQPKSAPLLTTSEEFDVEDDRSSTSTADESKGNSLVEVETPGKGNRPLTEVVMQDKKRTDSPKSKTSVKKNLPASSDRPKSSSCFMGQEIVTLVTGKGEAPFVVVQKGQDICVGKKVLVKRSDSYDWGTLRYLPKVDDDEDFAGIELDKPTGKNNGFHDKKKKQYFTCANKHGVFTKVSRVYLPALTEEAFQV